MKLFELYEGDNQTQVLVESQVIKHAGTLLRECMQYVKQITEKLEPRAGADYTRKLARLLQQYKQLQTTGASRQELDPFMDEIKRIRTELAALKSKKQDPDPNNLRSIPTHTLEEASSKLHKIADRLLETAATFAIDDPSAEGSINFTTSDKKYDIVNPEIKQQKQKSKEELLKLLKRLVRVYQNLVNSYRGNSDPIAKRADGQRAQRTKQAINRIKAELKAAK